MERTPSHIDDVSLSNRLKEKDRSGLDYLYEVHGPSLYGIVCRIVPDEKTAEKALEAVFRTIWQEAAAYDPQKTTLFTWMMAIARQQARQHVAPAGPLPQNHSAGPRALAYQSAQLIKLSLEEREIVNLIIFAGHTETEVARQLDISVDTVRSRLRLAFLTLGETLQPLS